MIAHPLVIRVDASKAIGIGHVMRMLALAQAYSLSGGKVVFATIEIPTPLASRLDKEGFTRVQLSGPPASFADATNTVTVARRVGAKWIVIDGYHFDATFQRTLKDQGFQVFVMDDFGHANFYWADLVLNQNSSAVESLYGARSDSTRLLLGPKYLLLRNEFIALRRLMQHTRPSSKPLNLLVTFGGSDQANLTGTILNLLSKTRLPNVGQIVVLIGNANPHLDSLHSFVQDSHVPVRMVYNPRDVASVFSEASLALAAAGTTAWELAAAGVPSLLFVVAENQRLVAAELARNDAAIDLGEGVDLSPEKLLLPLMELLTNPMRRHVMRNNALELVDGHGAARISSYLTGSGLWLRNAEPHDMELLWHWANDPSARANSFNPDGISWETHTKWFDDNILSGKSLCYIAVTSDEQSVGQVRFDGSGNQATISVSVDATNRNRGHGSRLIELATRRAMLERDYDTVNAYIKQENEISLRAFARAGFNNVGTLTIKGVPAVNMRILRDALLDG